MSPVKELTDPYETNARRQKGFLWFSLRLKQSLSRIEMDEEKKTRIRNLMSQGIQTEREYPRIRSDKKIRGHLSYHYHPAADYFRCYLSKATCNVMARLTPRYKNEAARNEFFTELVTITEAIHLSESNHRIVGIFENRDSKVTDTVLREVKTLAKSYFDPNEEIRQKLAVARRELSEFILSAENLLGVKWEKSEKYDEKLMLVSFFDPWYFENEKTEKWGVVYYINPTTMNVAPPVMCSGALRRSVIAREAVNLLTPCIADSAYRLYEQSEYLATKLLKDKYEKEFWLLARHGLREETKKDVAGNLVDFFSYYEMFVGDDLYKQAWSRLAEMTRLSAPLGRVSEYGRILDAIAARPVRVQLTQGEIALFTVLSERPNMPLSEIARRIGTSIPTATKLLQRLTQKACLRFSAQPDDRALGLEEHLLLIKTPRANRLPPVLWRIPYCRDIYRLYGSMDYFVVLNVPEGKGSFIRKLESTLEDCDLVSDFTSCEATNDFSNLSFEYFDPNESIWHVHWDSWGAGLAKGITEGQTLALDQTFHRKVEKIHFDMLDLQILERFMYNSRSSYSEIGKALGVTGAYVSRKVHRLLGNRVFRAIAKPWKIGAEEYGLITIRCENRYVEPLVVSLNKLPAWRGAAVKGDFEGLFAQVGVPSGEVNQLFMIVDDRLIKTRVAECSFNVVGLWSSLRRWIPITLYTRDEGWKFEENRYLSLVDQYGKK
jgi:DNA-binding Lrp family transcriptional regulator